MSFSQEVLAELSSYLEKTLSPDPAVRRPAEKYLQQIESQENFGPLLLYLTNHQELAQHLRVVASVTFKNYIKRHWRLTEETDFVDKISAADRQSIKASIIELMLTSPEKIQRQLSDAISLISREDFPDKWPDLLVGMVERMKNGDFNVINGVLRTAHSIFKRYRHEFQSNDLWKEIKYVLGIFAIPLTELFQTLMGMIEKNASDQNALSLIFSSLTLTCKIFRSLNAQDFPEEFEDTMEIWMSHFLTLLTYDNALLHSQTDEAGYLEQVKSQICDNISLFAQNYGENFGDYLPKFVSAVWDLLVSTSLESKYDLLVSNAIQFITAVVQRPQYRSLFENEESLKNICEKIVIPNLFLREVDIECFEDNPEEYIRKDIERSDVDTRRRAASDLVQALSTQFEKEVVAIFSSYVTALLQESATDPKKNWRQKDVALFLVTTLASKGQTKKHGTTKASELIDITQFYESTILPDLSDADVNNLPVIKADAIRYIQTFRQQLSKDTILQAFPHLIRHLRSEVPVVNTYACHAIERLLTLKATIQPPSKETLLSNADLAPIAQTLVVNLMTLLEPARGQNEYVVKALMRVCLVLQDSLEPFLDEMLAKLTELLGAISKNPAKPNFNHYLFETFGVLIRAAGTKNTANNIQKFEAHLFPIFNYVLEQDITEFIPYAFQLLSLMLELQSGTVPQVYHELFPFLLMPVLWERPGYIPALTRLLQAYVEKTAESTVVQKIMPVLGVFQRLIASKSNDHYAFYILNSLTEHLPASILNEYIKQILYLLFQRLNSSKTTKLVKNMLVFLSLYAYKYTPVGLFELIDNLQPGMSSMVLEKLFVPDLQKVAGNLDRKICAVGVAKILSESPSLLSNEANLKIWASLLESLVCLFELPEDNTVADEDHFINVEENTGYQSSFNQLFSATRKQSDPFNGQVPDAKAYLAKQLSAVSNNVSFSITSLLSQLTIESQKHLQQYLSESSVQLK